MSRPRLAKTRPSDYNPSMPLTDQDFSQLLDGIDPHGAITVAVSGGPDSMALCWMLSQWAAARGIAVHAITVDHGLRPEAAQEAMDVGVSIAGWPAVKHVILRWEGDKPQTRILEEARAARYDLIRDYMQKNGIRHLFTAHHQDDQAETFLIRLAKGSGLDGLSGMQRLQELQDGIILCRPLLGSPKADLVALCMEKGIPFALDPTNENGKYLRPRLRGSWTVLEEEGLTSKRLSVTAARLARARKALESTASDLGSRTREWKDTHNHRYNWSALRTAPEELILRVLLAAVDELHPSDDYGPRMEKMETLLSRLLHEKSFKSATLGGCIFALSAKGDMITITREKA